MSHKTAPSQYWIVKHEGKTVAKFDTAGETRIPTEIVDNDSFKIEAVSSRQELNNHTIDVSELSESEKNLIGVYS